MTDLEKIDQLICSKTKENNYLAMCMMLDILELPFEDAFLKLQLCEENPCRFNIEIAELKISYSIELFRAIDVPSDWGYMYRDIFVNGEAIENSSAEIYIEEHIAWRLSVYEEDRVEDLALLQNDIKDIIPLVKELFYNAL